MAASKQVFRQIISEKRLQVSEGVFRLNEKLRNYNSEVINILSRCHDTSIDGKLREILKQEIDRMLNESIEYDQIQSMAMQSIINLEELSKTALDECVIKYWNDYIDDVLKALNAIDVHDCYENQDVMKGAMMLEKKVHLTMLFN